MKTKSLKLNVLAVRELGVIAIILLIYLIVGLIEPRFYSFDVIVNVLLFTPVLMMIALGEMMAILSQNIDVSLGSIMGFAATVGGMVFRANKEFPILIVFAITVAVGIILGFINGLIVTRFKLPSVIVTLGTMNIFRGLIFILMNAKQIDNMYIPKQLIMLSQPMKSIIGIPYIVLISFAAAILVSYFLRKTKTGREIYAVGCNREAAQIRGIDATKISMLVFCLAGGLSGFASMMFIRARGVCQSRHGGLGHGVYGGGCRRYRRNQHGGRRGHVAGHRSGLSAVGRDLQFHLLYRHIGVLAGRDLRRADHYRRHDRKAHQEQIDERAGGLIHGRH